VVAFHTREHGHPEIRVKLEPEPELAESKSLHSAPTLSAQPVALPFRRSLFVFLSQEQPTTPAGEATR
jgi:hypothetical protein